MDDRYEIKGKIGQGGIGAVYRAFDKRMNREVAIKRIVPEKGKGTDEGSEKGTEEVSEATRQMTKEAGALAALQHPHIVTVYDVGVDEDGPYVVMELLTGKTLDEVVTRAPMTGTDFREFCLQTQEALIAAQDLGIVHRDLKPGNVMLTWLPSGKFQVKIVDFGLAKFSPKASLQTLDQQDSIYGSIFYMAPEQFERVPLDSRTDMYAIGCVYYFALTGKNPFDGDTGPQVMASHLGHVVTSLNELRPDLPKWLCDWVMWHINRLPTDRPADARQSLQIFLQNDAAPLPVQMSEPVKPTPPAPPMRPRLIIPGGAPGPTPTSPAAVTTAAPMVAPPSTQTMPQPLLPPEGSLPSIHTTSVHPVAAAASPDSATGPIPVAIPVAEAIPVAVMVPTGPLSAGGSALTPPRRPPAPPAPGPAAVPAPAPRAQATATRQASAAKQASATRPAPTQVPVPARPSKKPMIFSLLATILALLAVCLYFVYQKIEVRKREDEFKALLTSAVDPKTTEVALKKTDLDRLIRSMITESNLGERQKVTKSLALGKSTDGENIDARVLELALDPQTPGERREELFREVIVPRKNPEALPSLMNFIRESKDEACLYSAILAATPYAGDEQFSDFLNILKIAKNDQTRTAAEQALIAIIGKSQNAAGMKKSLNDQYSTTANPDLQRSLKKVLGP